MGKKLELGIIGGSGLYDIDGIDNVKEIQVSTPFGMPSDKLVTGTLNDVQVAFLPRHARGHRTLPHEINYRANIWALKKLGATKIISVSAVGSMRTDYQPSDIVLPDQIFDRTKNRINTFFGNGIAAHIEFSEPFCNKFRAQISDSIIKINKPFHPDGTYICIEGPQFSTKAESKIYRSWGVDIIGMTAIPEAKLAREAEMCYVALAMVTDYDVWKEGEEVSVETVIKTLQNNVNSAKEIINQLTLDWNEDEVCSCQSALENSIMTSSNLIPIETREKLDLLIRKYVD